ncbi:MAG: hypothetical protein KBE65_17160 [Phycisphaerae bacterium]|nr:hypothetical protein [Phycisphaerae bacterium]
MTTLRKPVDGRSASRRIERMKRSTDPLARQCALILEGFARTVRTEGAFYLRWCTLAPMEKEALAARWGFGGDDWRMFRRVCRFFGV